jgi:transcriptional regulator with PAS, ATPase and Fis domain
LRVIQEQEFLSVGGVQPKKVDLRFIVATNKNLEKLVNEKKFREDLYYRLNVVSITIPPLREKKEDIPILGYHFLKKFNQEMGKDIKSISVEAMNKLINYEWPGNVRQLENVIERAVVMAEGQTIISEYLPASILGKGADIDTKIPKDSEELKQMKKYLRESAVENVEKMFVLEALNRNDWNVTRTAKEVGMQRTNLQALMRKYNIRVREENE